MEMKEERIEDFLNNLSSSAPTPGGGGAAGLVAAVGMALGDMVLSLTTGKKKYAEYQEEIEVLMVRADELQEELLLAMDKDAKAFEPLAKAYALPKETFEEVDKRNQVMEEALYDAAKAPLEMMEVIVKAMHVIERVAEIGSKLAISDAGCGIQMCGAALNSASLNVYINTKMMNDRLQAVRFEKEAEELLLEGAHVLARTYQNVLNSIRS